MAYPHSRSETLADGTVHLIGLLVIFPASVMLLMQAAGQETSMVAIALYVVTILLSFTISALYHLLPFDRLRPVLGRIDHAAIYFKIAGTYTPFVFLIGSGFAYGVLGVVWALALVGAAAKLWFWRIDGQGSLALYLGMGWLSVLLLWPMWQALPGAAMALITVGGLTYSAGTYFFAREGLRFQNAIWHVFVLAASICFFVAVHMSIQQSQISL